MFYSPRAKIGTLKNLRVQAFVIDPASISVLKENELGCHDGNLGELFFICITANWHIINIWKTESISEINIFMVKCNYQGHLRFQALLKVSQISSY